jgi:flagellum-specific peptidoglycan hydrolase FlgJ
MDNRQKTLTLLIGALLIYLVGRWEATAPAFDAEELGLIATSRKANTVAFDDLKDYASAQNFSDDEAGAFIRALLPACLVEQTRYGIPASIKLAQALIESNGGKSRLARKTNNIYGVKSFNKKDKRSQHHDDKPSDHFRMYNTRWESIRAHSLLLSTSSRYAALFAGGYARESFEQYRDLEGRNGKAYGPDPNFDAKLKALKKHWNTPHLRWAYGLDVVGYATDNAYAKAIVGMVEKYNLDQYDRIKVVSLPK